jgi:hypothetical protein
MNWVDLSLTLEHGLSLTADTAYRKPKSLLTHCSVCEIKSLNYANLESFGFFLTQHHARHIVDKFHIAVGRLHSSEQCGDRHLPQAQLPSGQPNAQQEVLKAMRLSINCQRDCLHFGASNPIPEGQQP